MYTTTLAKQDIQCRASLAKWNYTHLVIIIRVNKKVHGDGMDTSTECTVPKEAGDDRETFRRIVEWEMKRFWWSWVAKLAVDRHQWYASVLALCASTYKED